MPDNEQQIYTLPNNGDGWATGDVITADKMNAIGNALHNASAEVANAVSGTIYDSPNNDILARKLDDMVKYFDTNNTIPNTDPRLQYNRMYIQKLPENQEEIIVPKQSEYLQFKANFVSPFSKETNYKVGEYVEYNDKVYKVLAAISANASATDDATAWNAIASGSIREINVMQELDNLINVYSDTIPNPNQQNRIWIQQNSTGVQIPTYEQFNNLKSTLNNTIASNLNGKVQLEHGYYNQYGSWQTPAKNNWVSHSTPLFFPDGMNLHIETSVTDGCYIIEADANNARVQRVGGSFVKEATFEGTKSIYRYYFILYNQETIDPIPETGYSFSATVPKIDSQFEEVYNQIDTVHAQIDSQIEETSLQIEETITKQAGTYKSFTVSAGTQHSSSKDQLEISFVEGETYYIICPVGKVFVYNSGADAREFGNNIKNYTEFIPQSGDNALGVYRDNRSGASDIDIVFGVVKQSDLPTGYLLKKIESINSEIESINSDIVTENINVEFEESLQKEQGDHFCMAMQSDIHFYQTENQINILKLPGYFSKDIGFDCFVNLGDIMRGYADRTLEQERSDLSTAVKIYVDTCDVPVLLCKGNHDDAALLEWNEGEKSVDNIIQPAEQYARIIKPIERYGITRNATQANAKYYYKDFPNSKVRVVVLDTSDVPYYNGQNGQMYACAQWDYGYANDQINWFAETLAEIPTGWAAVICSHITLYPSLISSIDARPVWNTAIMLGIVKAFQTGGSYSQTYAPTGNFQTGNSLGGWFDGSVSIDFNGVAHQVVCFSGHAHQEITDKVDGVRHIILPNFSSKQAVDFYYLDKENSKVYLKAYGRTPTITQFSI